MSNNNNGLIDLRYRTLDFSKMVISSKKDFRNKVFISKKESSETLYWLQLLEEFTDSNELKKLQIECQEIILILQKIINTLDNKGEKSPN